MISVNSISSNNITFRSAGKLAQKIINKKTKTISYAPAIVSGSIVTGFALQANFNPIKLREQAKRYNEKEPSDYENFRDDLINRIMETNKKIHEKEKSEEELKPEDYKIPDSAEMEKHRLPDFSELNLDENLYDDFINMDHTPVILANFKKEAAIIKNKQLKTITETICRKKQLNRSLLNYIRDIDAGLYNITDAKILKHVKAELKKLADINYDTEHYDKPETGEWDFFFALDSVAAIVDTYNTMKGRYSRYKTGEIFTKDVFMEKSKPAAYVQNFRQYAPENYNSFIKALYTEGVNKHFLVTDFESTQKTEALETLSKKKELLDYIYDKYYVCKIKNAKTKRLCREISAKYGTHVLLSNKTKNINNALTIIRDEFENWTKASEGKAKLPAILDMNVCDNSYVDSSAYTDIRGNIHYKGARLNTPAILRHEIMHLNEPSLFGKYSADTELAKLIRSIIASKKVDINGTEKEVLDWENCKYKEEFLKAGISTEHIEYAYTNRNEFLAVAAEGDLSQYSPEFKEILMKIGMPEFVFNLSIDDITVEENVERVKDILEEHPNANYDQLVKYVEEKKAQELSPREKLLNAIFGKIFGKI